jgi:general stress protein YciG
MTAADESHCNVRQRSPTFQKDCFRQWKLDHRAMLRLPSIRWVSLSGGKLMANEKQSGGSERGGSGNFANDPQRASEAGKKGGEASHGGGSQQQGDSQSQSGGSRGGSGNFANDPEKASEAGKNGGGNSRGGK